MRRTWRSFMVMAVLAHAGTVHAESDARVSLDYQGTRGCPDESWFVRRIGKRTQRVTFAPKDQGAPLRLLVSLSNEALEGWLDLRGVGVLPLVRRVSGKTCNEIADALSLIVAMTLDPTVAPTTPMSRPATAPASEPPASSSTELTTAAPTGPPAMTQPHTEPRTRKAPKPPVAAVGLRALTPSPLHASPEETTTPVRTMRVDVGIGAAVVGGIAPDPSVGAFAFVEVSRARPSLFSPALVLAAEFDQSPTTSVYVDAVGASGSAHFTRVLGRVQACPLRFPLAPTFGVLPCLMFEFGRLTGSGRDITGATDQRDRWLAPATGMRLEWLPGPTVLLALDGIVLVPLVQEHFYFAPNTTIHQVPGVSIGAMFSAAATLW